MIDRRYKSILDITGVRLPTALSALQSKTKRKDIVIEEQFQVAYIMFYLESKTYVQIAKMLAMTTYKVKKILTSFICNMMKLHDWNPMYLCSNRDVARDENGYVFEYADLHEITNKLDDFDKSNSRKDNDYND